MTPLLRLLPMILAIFKRARVLAGATSSGTTRVQWTALVVLGVVVAAVGHFVPDFASEEVQSGLMLALVAAIGPLVSRYLGFRKDEDISIHPLDDEASGVMLTRVRAADTSVWYPFCGGIEDARLEGHWAFGTEQDGTVWDIETGKKTGDVLRVRKSSNEESDRVLRQAKEALEKLERDRNTA